MDTIVHLFSALTSFKILPSRSRDAILYLYGTFNPMHSGHVKALVEAKHWLENEANYHVCAVRVAITIDENLQNKFSKSNEMCIKFEHRLKLCELACADYPWIEISPTPAESQAKYGVQIRKELKKPNAILVVLVGSDRAFLLHRRISEVRKEKKFILCVGREGMSESAKKAFEEAAKNDPKRSLGFYVIPIKQNDSSSTAIRKDLENIKEAYDKGTITSDMQLVKYMTEVDGINGGQGEYVFHNVHEFCLPK